MKPSAVKTVRREGDCMNPQLQQAAEVAALLDRQGMRYRVNVVVEDVDPEPQAKEAALRRLAYHEAGHAAADAMLNALHGVTGLELDGDILGGALVGYRPTTPIGSIAGAWAAARYEGTAFDFVNQYHDGPETEYGGDWDNLLEFKPPQLSAAAWVASVEGQADRLLSLLAVWPCIEACAEALLAAPQDASGVRWLDVDRLQLMFAPIMGIASSKGNP